MSSIETSRLLNNNCDDFFEILNERRKQHEHEHEHGHHHHDHDHSHKPKSTWRLITMIVLNIIFMLAELIVGFWSKSLALQSDAFHMLSDIASLFIGLYAHRLSKDPPTPTMTFGWARTEVLGGLINAVFMLAICFTMFLNSIERFIDIQEIKKPLLFLIVSALGLLVNVLGLFIFHDHDHSDNLKGVFIHVLGDFFGSVGAVISACVVYFTKWKYRYYIDPALTLLIVIILVYGSTGLFKRTAKIVIERCPESINSEEVSADIITIPSVVTVHELHIWELSREQYIALIHIVVDSKDHHKNALEGVHNIMMSYGIFSTTVQIEFIDDFPDGVNQNESCFYGSAYGGKNRVFTTTPVYKHCVGCPHLFTPGEENSSHCDEHDHDHDHHHHDHEHDHDHDHHHDHEHEDEHHHDHTNEKGKKKHNHTVDENQDLSESSDTLA